MFKIVAILATLAVAQADPLAFGYGTYAHGGAYGGAHVAAHAHVAMGYQAHGYAGHGFGHHHEAQPFLSCYARTDYDQGGPGEGGISVNIKPRTYGYGLEATINVWYGVLGGDSKDVIISFTEQSDALQTTSCSGAAYGNFLGPSSYEHDDDHSADHGFGYGFGHGYKAVAPSVAHTTIGYSMMASFHIDDIEGFTSMEQLAGRGVIVCLKDQAKKVDGHWVCNTTDDAGAERGYNADLEFLPVACCNLHYSAKGDTLNADGSRHVPT